MNKKSEFMLLYGEYKPGIASIFARIYSSNETETAFEKWVEDILSNKDHLYLIKTDINKIHFRNISQDVIILHISKSDSFTSVKHIINGNISLLIIDECEIHELTKHNAHHVYRAEIDCTSLFSFRGVEDFDVKIKLKFYNINSVENMINLLNNNCEIIKLDSFTLEYST